MLDIKIDLTNQNGFIWYNAKGINFKGYLLINGEYLTGLEAIDLIKEKFNEDDSDEISRKISGLNGVFAFIYEKSKRLMICADRMRSFPLFYFYDENQFILTDEPDNLKDTNFELDDNSIKIFLHTGYVTGEKTLLKDIFQVQAGEIVIVSNEIKRNFYHNYKSEKLISDERFLENELDNILNQIGDDLASSLKGKTPVVPLSSGFDSRLIVTWLKKRGFDNVITFTYGRKGNPELELSEKTAKMLGYEWRFIEYNEETVKGFITSDNFKKYYPKASNYTSMFYLQEFFAMEVLKSSIPENSVIIPGHSGDFFAGSHLNERIISATSKENIIKEIILKHFANKKTNEKSYPFIYESIEKFFGDKRSFSYLDFENWDLKERQAKFIINSNRIYEYFGLEYRLPLMDSRLMDFFSNVHPELKFSKKLYDKVLQNKFFRMYDMNFVKKETNPSVTDLKVQSAKDSIKKILPKKMINFYKEKVRINSDIYFNIGVTDEMIKDLINFGAVIDETGENRNSIIIQWYIHQVINSRI